MQLVYPRLREEIVLVAIDGGVVVDGLPNLELLSGIVSETLLPILLPKLDGTRSVDDLIAEFAHISEEYVSETLGHLSSWGLLIDGPSQVESILPQHLFLNRYDLAFRMTEPQPAGLQLLQTSVQIAVAYDATTWLGMALLNELIACGIPNVAIKEQNSKSRDLRYTAVLHLSRPNHGIIKQCELFVILREDTSALLIGPLADSAGNGCVQCYEKVLGFGSASLDVPGSIEQQLIVSFLAWETLDILLELPTALGASRIRQYDIKRATNETIYVPCHILLQNAHDTNSDNASLSTALVYNDRISDEYSHRVVDHSVHGPDVTRPPASEFAVARRISLPRGDCDLSATAISVLFRSKRPSRRPVTMSSLAALCSFGVGYKIIGDRQRKRWTPSAGNFGSPRLHLLTPGMGDLEAGLYSYDAISHELVDRRTRSSATVEHIYHEVVGGSMPSDATLLILTARRDVLFNKYREFSYKLSNLDAGVTVAQVDLVASAMGHALRIVPGWPDDLLARELNLRTDDEHVTVVLEVRPRRWFRPKRQAKQFTSEPLFHEPKFFSKMSIADITTLLIEEGKFRPAINPGNGGGKLNRFQRLPVLKEQLHSLPPRALSPMTVAGVLDRRSSIRTFSPMDVSLSGVSTILQSAWMNDEIQWADTHLGKVPLAFTILKRSASDAMFSVLRYVPEYQMMRTMYEAITEKAVKDMFVQEEFSLAPLTILISAVFGDETSGLASAAYRLLLLRAGAAGHRINLTGIALGLEGTLLAGLKPDAIREHIPDEVGVQTPLLACSLGQQVS